MPCKFQQVGTLARSLACKLRLLLLSLLVFFFWLALLSSSPLFLFSRWPAGLPACSHQATRLARPQVTQNKTRYSDDDDNSTAPARAAGWNLSTGTRPRRLHLHCRQTRAPLPSSLPPMRRKRTASSSQRGARTGLFRTRAATRIRTRRMMTNPPLVR